MQTVRQAEVAGTLILAQTLPSMKLFLHIGHMCDGPVIPRPNHLSQDGR